MLNKHAQISTSRLRGSNNPKDKGSNLSCWFPRASGTNQMPSRSSYVWLGRCTLGSVRKEVHHASHVRNENFYGSICPDPGIEHFTQRPNAQAQTLRDWDRPTLITVNVLWQVPGTTLAPGRYVMKLADVRGTRTVVQIFSKDGRQLLATVIGITAYRPRRGPDPPMVHFNEVEPGSPEQLHTWYYPGNSGVEFVYPAKR